MEHSVFDKLLKEQIRYWQEKLKLVDWTITLDYWPHKAFDGSVSKIQWSRNQKTATIAVRVPEDIPPVERDWPEGEAVDYDMTIVHELLHLKCVDMECKVEWAEEQLANHLTQALVGLYREHNPAKPIEVTGAQTGHYI